MIKKILSNRKIIHKGIKGLWSSSFFPFSQVTTLEYIKFEVLENKVGFVTFNRPKNLNALCDGFIYELNKTLFEFDHNDKVGAIVLTGSEKAFAAGGDIKEMNQRSFPENYQSNMLHHWEDISKIRKPIIAAVNGYALGGGCELAMMCDIIVAGSTAKFGQPEVLIGIIPGCGGTQRLVRVMGKSKGMEIVLTGDQFDAHTAEKHGLVSKVVDPSQTVSESIKIAEKIAKNNPLLVAMAKECINQSFNLTLKNGIEFERKLFQSSFNGNNLKQIQEDNK